MTIDKSTNYVYIYTDNIFENLKKIICLTRNKANGRQ